MYKLICKTITNIEFRTNNKLVLALISIVDRIMYIAEKIIDTIKGLNK